jgi:hypothetical protein
MNTPTWRLVPGMSHTAKVYYKGDPIGMLRSASFKVDAETKIPILTLEVLAHDLQIEGAHLQLGKVRDHDQSTNADRGYHCPCSPR